jgi:hypothetical protein
LGHYLSETTHLLCQAILYNSLSWVLQI